MIRRRHPRKTWMDCVKVDVYEKGESAEMTHNRPEWKKGIRCANPT